ncbi:hypothetical protein GT347_05880 [Xylophilus rhododendri]|uniref:Uncharacterized protein n=1 Tax=Xylophilus rhododendri TaxID=2697032 RepID=A0A857J350_9BURK|nr:hypothetical protein [Xylophilus rhododendri]QHI97559.1 hypothetical protein GT347_05880 [Xylophilus rhododendri]
MPMKLLCIGPYRVHTLGQEGLARSPWHSQDLRQLLRDALESHRPMELPPPWEGLQARVTGHDIGLSVRVSMEAASPEVRDRFMWRVLTALVPEQRLRDDPEPAERRWCAWIWHGGDMKADALDRLQIEAFVHAISKAWIEQMASTVQAHHLLH